ncbi:universal stress protein [Natronolimnobius sp. AArcel1]|uniref:universal stress protein n=1 Tax=Natronolimnobius sp. AArcel1 TaxID=1679093 RepID=UPI0013EDB30A|nr:universal stress protein [Natronolimnobius sp. AArcel1]NGM69404.1 universal stress protein [Natronolimnobius sp. AArcel1]
MPASLLHRVIVPVANEDDARATCGAICSHFDDDATTLYVVHIIEKGSGAPDKAPLEARQEQAQQIFAIAEDTFEETEYDLVTDLRYATNITDEIIAAVEERDATAITFIPRPSGTFTRLLTGNKTKKLVSTNSVPVIVLPRPTDQSNTT